MSDKPSPGQKHGGNIAILSRSNCAQLFFVYAGGLGMIEGMGPMAFLQKSGISDRNVAFVRDPNTYYFEHGVSEELPDLDAVLDWHQRHIAANPHVTEVYCIGNSFGGWSALFFGYMLAVRRVWALAPAGTWGRDLLRDLMAEPNGVTQYDLYYSNQEPKDVRFAEALCDAPGLTLHRRDAFGHMMIRGLLQSGELPRLMPRFLPVSA
jgi:hypothetical protein